MKTYVATFVFAFSFLSACAASPVAELEDRSGKPTGGPASATVTIYSSYQCTDLVTSPPSGLTVVKTFSISETVCVVAPLAIGNVFTASLTATPKTGAVGCYIQTFTQQSCGVNSRNEYHGFPFNGISIGSQIACAPDAQSNVAYGAFEIVCD